MSTPSASTLTLVNNLKTFLYYFRPVNVVLGTIGTFLDIILFSRRKFRTVSCCLYFLAAAVLIIFQIGVTSIIGFYGQTYGNKVTSIVAVCKFYVYTQQFTGTAQRWLMTAATFDRYACTSTKVKLRRFATVRVARYVILVIVIIWFIIPIYRLIFYTITVDRCAIVDTYVIALIHSIYIPVAGLCIPLLIMIPSLFLLRRNLRQKRQRRQVMGLQQQVGEKAPRQSEHRRDQQVLAILIVQIIVYCILIIPFMIFQIYNAITLSITNKSVDRITIEQSLASIGSDVLASIYSVTPFYSNTIISNMFRKELMIIVRNIFCCGALTKINQIRPLSNHVANKTAFVRSQLAPAPGSRIAVPNITIIGSASETHRQEVNIDQTIPQ